MTFALLAAMFFTVVLLVTTAYFLLGSVPLLVLEHDTPLDGRFVRGFFNTYYQAATFAAAAAAVSYGFAGRLAFAGGAAALSVLAVVLRRKVIARMDALRARIEVDGASAIRSFRRTHLSAIVFNLAQLGLIVWCLIAVSMQ